MLLSHYRRPLFLLLLAYAAAIALLRGFFAGPPAPPPFGLPRSGVPAEGRVAAYPASGPGGERFPLEEVSLYGRPYAGGLMVYAPNGSPASYGDRVSFLADLETPPAASAPGALDWAGYLAGRGIAVQARARDLDVVAGAGPVIKLARRLRYGALEAFEKGLGPEAAAVLGGVVLGEKRAVPPDLKLAFQDSGAMHLLVASGSNVGFVVAVVYLLGSALGLRRRWAGLAALVLSGLYVLAAGFDAPLTRAYLMFAAGLLAFLARREPGAFHALTAAGLVILLLSPGALFDAGFQMSFLAAYGLTVGMGLWGRYLPRGPAGKAAGLLLVSFFAQLGLYPLLAAYFHKVSLVSLVSNMALVPAAGVLMGLGFLLAAAAGVPWLFKPLAFAAGLALKAFIGTVKFFAALPFASLTVAEPSGWFAAGYAVLAFALLHAPLLGFRRPRLYAAAAAGLALAAVGPLKARLAGPASGPEALLFGSGGARCVLVRAPKGEIYIVNPGAGGRKLADAVLGRGSATVEAVLLTSLEERNYRGLAELGALVRVRRVLLPYGQRPAALERALAGLRAGGSEIARLWPGEPGPAGASCSWDGFSPGYAGSGDRFGWTVAGVAVSRDGAYAELGTGGSGGAASAEKGRVVALGGV